MSEADRAVKVLAALRDVGIAQPVMERVHTRVQAAVEREAATEATGHRARTRGSARRWLHRPTFATVVASVTVVISIVVAVTAVTLLSHRPSERSSTAGAAQLAAKLAVLRRPQTPADLLPAKNRHVQAVHHEGAIVPGLTRLIATRGAARFFLVVRRPAGGPLPTWSPKLGDQAAIIEVIDGHASETAPIPAADLTNADEVMRLGIIGRGSVRRSLGNFDVAIIPDGVARVRWTFASPATFKPGWTVTAPAADNIAIIPAQPGPNLVLRGRWYASDGQVIPTSNQAVLDANAARDAVLSARIIRYDEHHSYRAAPSLLAAFAVFAVTSPTGVRTAAGDVISHPPLSAIPYVILEGAATPNTPPQVDPEQIRRVITPSGVQLWVIPGRRGLCLATTYRSPFPDGSFGGGGSSCSPSVGQAESEGVGFSSGEIGSPTITARIVPKWIATITIRTSDGRPKTIKVPDGIYVGQTRRDPGNSR